MKIIFHISLLAVCLLTGFAQVMQAQENTIAFQETFDTNTVKGGRDGDFGNGSGTVSFVQTGWVGNSESKVFGANYCIRYGTGSVDGTLTTPTITLTGTRYALLTFSAAGWTGSAKNTLTVTASSGELSGDNNITELVNEEWNDYSVLITLPSVGGSFTLTFSGRRGFLDDVVVRNINTVPAPTLPNAYTFWPKTNEAQGEQTIALTHDSYTVAYYTTDGTEPSNTNGQAAMLDANLSISGTTTVKAVAYVGTLASEVVTRTYTQGTTATGLAAFKALAAGTEARLYLSDASNTRISFANSQQAYLEDGDNEVLCIDFGTTATPNPTPATQQHVGGWIVGKYQTVNGCPTLVATANTNTNYLALADRRNEATVTPTVVETSAINSNIGRWVTMSELNIGTVTTDNAFELTTAQPYEGAWVDITGIVTATNKIAPTEAVTFVIDEAKAFTSPDADIANATVRLKRTLKSSCWNTFSVPFDITTMDGQIREFDHVDGTTMKFEDAASIVAGKPYLVMPAEDVVNPVYEDVTLTATAAQTVTDGGYSFVATYSPVHLATDQTEQFLKTNGQLYYPTNASNQMKGLRAFFRVPKGATAHIALDDETTDIIRMENGEWKNENEAGAWYDLQGRRITNGQKPSAKGLYIHSGRKVVVK